MNATPDPRRMTIDVISDVVCPWCFIGRRRLGAALELLAQRRPEIVPSVSWHPFQLNPDLPRGGIERRTYAEAKFGGPEGAARVAERVRAVGRTVDIDFAFERIRMQPNTVDAHRLIAWAQRRGSAEDVVERLFRAFFLQGRNIGDHVVLAAVASESGFDRSEAAAMLATDQGLDTVLDMDRRVRELGVEAVPFFIFEGKVAVSGAHEPEALFDAMLSALVDTGT